jgi:proteic killer suppression protein
MGYFAMATLTYDGPLFGLVPSRPKSLSIAVTTPQGMDVPGWRFHPLKGKDRGRWAVWVDQNWRLTFAWTAEGPDAVDVDYEDYH